MKKFLVIFGSLLLVAVLAVGGYGYYLYSSAQDTVDSQMHENIDREQSDKRDVAADPDKEDPLSFLLLGTDEDDADSGRTDTMMVVTVNPQDESMKLVSIPRDTMVSIPGRGDDKINHAFAFGGAQLAMETVENYLDIPVDYYITINMDGFEEMVDAVGGVEVDNSFAFSQSGYQFQEGPQELDGSQALAYSRMRGDDPQGDLGRNERQREIVFGLIDEGASFSSITRAGQILDSLGNNMKTNLDFDTLTKVGEKYNSARHNQETLEINGEGTTIDGVYYLQVPEELRQEISNELRDHLNID
ncbi:LCP family protein [Salisediminibacterium halotolerans]|uniref:Cell envelope-related function transcriptional attenuator common domain-containing protein n=1 Tax=Salisediminibacterium halotolerans TaxID=517425 RepID=A0A1H9QJM9_9BACI|nr:LCP family protein [Salisediminibacterium haloalkalitolerans]SER60405.1 cell envelope-related function transcriptional attenuator common domain-containing protein [Salisediminibacterium haloalkalitolerans]